MSHSTFQRRAAIDIGTVTCRLLVADVFPDGEMAELQRESDIVNLGEGVDAARCFSNEAMQRVEDAVARYASIVDGYAIDGKPVPLVAVGTSACRDAENTDELASRLASHGVRLQVVPGTREAGLSFAGASRSFAGQSILVADIGGGSTELIAGVAGQGVLHAHSFDIGCRRVADRFLSIDPPDAVEMEQARAWFGPQLAEFSEQLAKQDFKVERLVAVAGTATSAVAIHQAMEIYDPSKVHGFCMQAETLDGVLQDMAAMTLQQRRYVAGLRPQRAGVIVPGLMILKEVVALAGTGSFTTSESDILQGILLSAF